MSVFIRSLAAMVSKAKLSGAIWIAIRLRGTAAGAGVSGVREVGEEKRDRFSGS